jgi:hypothetical protein
MPLASLEFRDVEWADQPLSVPQISFIIRDGLISQFVAIAAKLRQGIANFGQAENATRHHFYVMKKQCRAGQADPAPAFNKTYPTSVKLMHDRKNISMKKNPHYQLCPADGRCVSTRAADAKAIWTKECAKCHAEDGAV